MRRTLGTALLVVVLAPALLVGCGDGSGTTDASDGGSGADSAPPVTQVDLLTGPSAGGAVADTATELPDEEAVREYAFQFRNELLQREILHAAERVEVPEGQQLAAAVVAVGCEVPTEVVGTSEADGVRVAATMPPPEKRCLVPITSVALMLVPA